MSGRPDRPQSVLAAVMRWDYGDPARGPSCEDQFFVAALRRLVERVDVLWTDDLLGDPSRFAHEVAQAARRTGAELVFVVPYQDEVTAALPAALAGVAPSLAWFGDDQWRFDDFTRQRAGFFDHVVTTDPTGVHRYRELGVEPLVSQWAAVRPDVPRPPLDDDGHFLRDVSFVGAANGPRSWFVRRLQVLGVDVHCFGAGWPAGRLPAAEVDEVFRTSRINLNLSNSVPRDVRYVVSGLSAAKDYARSRKRAEQAKARHFEIPAAGGFQLTHYFVGLEDYFQIGGELGLFTSPEDCVLQVRRYLDEPERRMSVARRGHERALAEHTYEHRLARVFADVASRSV